MKALPPRLLRSRGAAFPDAFAKTSTRTSKEPYAMSPNVQRIPSDDRECGQQSELTYRLTI
jgi:hypothetical protein